MSWLFGCGDEQKDLGQKKKDLGVVSIQVVGEVMRMDKIIVGECVN